MKRRGFFGPFRVSDIPALFSIFVILLLVGASSDAWLIFTQEAFWCTLNFVLTLWHASASFVELALWL